MVAEQPHRMPHAEGYFMFLQTSAASLYSVRSELYNATPLGTSSVRQTTTAVVVLCHNKKHKTSDLLGKYSPFISFAH